MENINCEVSNSENVENTDNYEIINTEQETENIIDSVAPIIPKYYFIDYENVNCNGLNGIKNLSENDFVMIFYTSNANTLTFDLHKQIIKSSANIKYIETNTGSNALDFELSTYLGYIIGSVTNAEYFIISNDKGFENIQKFWKRRQVNIKIQVDIQGTPVISAPQVHPVTSSNNKISYAEFEKAISELKLSKQNLDRLWVIFNNSMSTKDISKRKQYISNNITQTFGNQYSKNYYAKIKPLIK